MPGDNIYPDLSNDKFDIQYARLLGLSSDLRASFGVEATIKPPGDFGPIEKDSDTDTGLVRFGVAGEDHTATENRSFDLAGAYSFALTQLGNNQFLVDPANGLYQLGAVPVPGSDSGLSYTYIEIEDNDKKITLQAPEGIVLPGYGYGNHAGTYTKFLAVDAGGSMIEVDAAGESGTVTSFSAGNLSPLFTTSVATATTTPALTFALSNAAGGTVFGNNGSSSAAPAFTSTPVLGIAGTTLGTLGLAGNTSGVITIKPQAAAGTFNFNLPITAGTSGYLLTSGGGGASPMTWTDPSTLGAGSITADNGLSMSTSTNVQLGGTLLQNTTVAGGASFVMAFSGSGSQRTLEAYSTGGGLGMRVYTQNATTNTVLEAIHIGRSSSGTAANGIGVSAAFTPQTSDGSLTRANNITSKWTDATFASRTSQFDFNGVNNTSDATIFSAHGSGVVGIGISSSFTATRLNVVDNAVGANSIVNITSTSTAAASSSQVGLSVGLSGANANSGQHTFGISVGNLHTGTTSTNYGFATSVSGGTTNYGVHSAITGTGNSAAFFGTNAAAGYVAWFAASSTGTAVFADATNGTAVKATTSGGTALDALSSGALGAAITSGAGLAMRVLSSPSSTNTITPVAEFFRGLGAGTGANGIGGSIDLVSALSAGSAIVNQITWHLTDATAVSRTSTMTLKGVLSAATVDLLTLAGDGSITMRPITATAASAITPAEGMMVFVSSTNGTFISIGPWMYYNGAWNAL